MSQVLNADELFKIGIQIEKNGQEFYLAAAAITNDPDQKKLFTELAEWESRHVSLFEKFRENLPALLKNDYAYDPENSIHQYLKSVADNTIFVKNNNSEKTVASCKNAKEVLEKALTFEKESVVYYSSMKQIVPESLGKSEIDNLVIEELRHVGILTQEIQKLS